MTLLDRVRESRARRDSSAEAFTAAIVAAAEKHSLRQIADAAGLTFSGVWQILQRQKERQS